MPGGFHAMRRSRVWLFLLLVLGLLAIVFVPAAVRHALAPGYADVDLRSLGYFPFDGRSGTDADIPKRWRKLDGKRVALEGFMFDGEVGRSAGLGFPTHLPVSTGAAWISAAGAGTSLCHRYAWNRSVLCRSGGSRGGSSRQRRRTRPEISSSRSFDSMRSMCGQ